MHKRFYSTFEDTGEGCSSSTSNEKEETQDNFIDMIPRDYQREMFRKACQDNSILYLPTGAGKTFISIMLMRHFAPTVSLPYLEGGKRYFFIAPLVELAEQQWKTIRDFTSFTVARYLGSMQVDNWTSAQWQQQFIENQVLVMTAQILLNLLSSNFINMDRISLLVIDECHHTTEDHPMNVILRNFYKPGCETRIIGLTATLIKRNINIQNVNKEVSTLENNLRSKIITLDCLDELKGLYANPHIKCVTLHPVQLPKCIRAVENMFNVLQQNLEILEVPLREMKKANVPTNVKVTQVLGGTLLSKEMKKMILDVKYHLNLGVCGGDLAVLAHKIIIQRLLCTCQKDEERNILELSLETLICSRKIFQDEMSQYTEVAKLEKCSSPKVRKLIAILGLHLEQCKQLDEETETEDTTLRAIVFVDRRITAKVLFYILEKAKRHDPKLRLMRPTFIVGHNKRSFDTREYLMEDNRNRKALEEFKTGKCNLIVASSVLEEGMDVPECNLVIKFDVPKTFCSFIQSKGRARDQSALFYVLDEVQPCSRTFQSCQASYHQIENTLRTLQNEETNEPKTQEIAKEESFVTETGASCRVKDAVRLVYRFCQSLGNDKFTDLTPLWFKKKISGNVQCTLMLPLNSYYRQPIEGVPCINYKDARNSAAFTAVKKLHEVRALDNDLKLNQRTALDLKQSKELFPHFKSDEKISGTIPRGSKKYKVLYDKHIPATLTDCAPTDKTPVYMHVLAINPAYEIPSDIRRSTFHMLLQDQSEGFAVLTSKQWPKLCQFPIFMGVGKVMVTVMENYKTLMLSSHQLESARHMHVSLFTELLNINHPFLKEDFTSGDCNLLLVPTKVDSGDFSINVNWTLISEKPNFKITDIKLTGDEKDLELSVIAPWYRDYNNDSIISSNRNYIVAKVDYDMNPDSKFPNNSSNFSTFREYYLRKHQLTITKSNQPLLLVKCISTRLNFLHSVDPPTRQFNRTEDFEEILIPELCNRTGAGTIISSQLWLKATAMPSILFRLTRFLNTEELRQQICKATGLGKVNVSSWNPMFVESNVTTHHQSEKMTLRTTGYGPPQIRCFTPNIIQHTVSWDVNKEQYPVDIDTNMEKVTLLEINEFEKFVGKKSVDSVDEHSPKFSRFIPRDYTIKVRPIAMLNAASDIGPQLHTLYAALTTTMANETVDMERLESLGDSFLKFATSVYLFCKYDESEGILTDVKGKIVGNQNLMYCGVAKNINGILSVQPLDARTDWKVPNLEVDKKLKEFLEESKLSSTALQHFSMTPKEKKTGTISAQTWQTMLAVVLDDEKLSEENNPNGLYDAHLNKHKIADKNIADCVEAILGAYVENCGPTKATKLLTWFGILPPDIEEIIKNSVAPVGIKDFQDSITSVSKALDRHLSETVKLEKQLNYKFNNRGILLQAISHASYISNTLTDSFERLEFIGDAVLDFLITSHIYEQNQTLSPGDLTDLRSALVNNVTFASLAVRFGFHHFLQYESQKIMQSIENFVKYQEENNHCINGEYLLLLQEDSTTQCAYSMEVPKILGDIFESLAGAVFLDSNKSLIKTWEVFYPLMKKEIDLFSAKIPKQPVRMLYESVPPGDIDFSKPFEIEDKKFIGRKLILNYQGKKYKFIGVGENKIHAKIAAAKCAYRFLMAMQQTPNI